LGFNSLGLLINDPNPYLRAQAVDLLRTSVLKHTELCIDQSVLIAGIFDSKIFDEIQIRIENKFEGDGPFLAESILALLFACICLLRDAFRVKLALGASLIRCVKAAVDPKDPLMQEFRTTEFPGKRTKQSQLSYLFPPLGQSQTRDMKLTM
jgi:hypothetical protein